MLFKMCKSFDGIGLEQWLHEDAAFSKLAYAQKVFEESKVEYMNQELCRQLMIKFQNLPTYKRVFGMTFMIRANGKEEINSAEEEKYMRELDEIIPVPKVPFRKELTKKQKKKEKKRSLRKQKLLATSGIEEEEELEDAEEEEEETAPEKGEEMPISAPSPKVPHFMSRAITLPSTLMVAKKVVTQKPPPVILQIKPKGTFNLSEMLLNKSTNIFYGEHHDVNICDKNFQSLSENLTNQIENGRITEAIQQIDRCIDFRESISDTLDYSHAGAVKILNSLKNKILQYLSHPKYASDRARNARIRIVYGSIKHGLYSELPSFLVLYSVEGSENTYKSVILPKENVPPPPVATQTAPSTSSSSTASSSSSHNNKTKSHGKKGGKRKTVRRRKTKRRYKNKKRVTRKHSKN
jgi:hypothetical protein